MSTQIRPELSLKNQYYIPRHRYYELLHFCKQYADWKKEVSNYSLIHGSSESVGKNSDMVDHTATDALNITRIKQKMKLVEQTCLVAEPELAPYLFRGVTEGLSYNALYSLYEIPCSKDQYYFYYRKFFWLLSKQR